jgi:UDP:flavonoid glycosyltransferase YjiC (YdhE family)
VKEVQSEDEQKATYFHHSSGAETHGSVEAASNLMNSFMMATEDDASEIQPAEPNSNQLNVYQSRLYERCLSSSTIPTQQDKLHHSGVHINVFPAASHNQESLSNTNPLLGQSEKKTFGFRYPYPKMRKLSVPKLNILIMAVGTRGDIQPFRQFGMRLKEDGHRVRLATHELFRSYILEKGLEFYPLAGDPILLSEFMGKTGGSILPLSTEILKEVPKFHTMICDIVSSAWKSCLEPDPKDEDAKPFAADVIISNPVTYGHCHCAEALGIPLHLMFPQPWVPTKAFSHPLSRLSYSKSWHTENYVSYEIVDRALWLTFERDLNQFRVSVGLEPFRLGQYGWNLLNYHQVPFVKMWSPSIVPKPKDWPEHVDIVGSFLDISPSAAPIRNNAGRIIRNNGHIQRTQTATPIRPLPMNLNVSQQQQGSKLVRSRMFDPKVYAAKLEDSLLPVAREPKEVCPELIEFLEKPGCIIYVGFGSMVVPNMEALVALFLEAAALTKVRLLFQQGWSKIDANRFEELAKKAQEKAIRVQSMLHADDLVDGSNSRSNSGDKNSKQTEADSAMNRLEQGGDHILEEPMAHEWQSPIQPQSSNWLFSMIRTAVATTSPLLSGSKNSAVNNSSTAAFKHTKEKIDEWDDLSNDTVFTNTWNWETDAFYMAECPHTWLFQQVSAVVHHGGAGTTSTGLRYGRPTWICPFFGDQFFWGEMMYRRNFGPKPCPVGNLNLMEIVSAFEVLQRESTLRAAEAVGESMAREDGVENAVRAFYQHLPLENMVCEVSLMMAKRNDMCQAVNNDVDSVISVPTELAQVYCVQCGLKMTQENADILHSDAGLHMQDHEILPCCYFDWSIPKPESATDGVVQGVGGYVHEFLEGVADVVYDPVHGGIQHGLQGAATGLVKGLNTFVDRQIQGGAVLMEKIVDGVSQSGKDDDDCENREELHIVRQSPRSKGGVLVHGQQFVQSAKSVAFDWIRAGATVIAGAAPGSSGSANNILYEVSSPTSTIASPHGRPRNRSEATDASQSVAVSAKKKPVRFINHRASAKTLEVRSLRTNIHQQIRRLQEQQRVVEDEKRKKEQANTLFPHWSREKTEGSPLCANQQSEGALFGGQHNQSFIVHSSSFGCIEMQNDSQSGMGLISLLSSSSQQFPSRTMSLSQEIAVNETTSQPLNSVTSTPTRRAPFSSSGARGVSSTITETILERSRENDDTPIFSPSATNHAPQDNLNDSKVVLPAILFQGTVNDALKTSIIVTPLDPFETEPGNEQEFVSNNGNVKIATGTSPAMNLPSLLPIPSTSAGTDGATSSEAADQFVLQSPREDVSPLSESFPSEHLMNDISASENIVEDEPFLLETPGEPFFAETITVEKTSTLSSPKIMSNTMPASLNSSHISLPHPSEPILPDLSMSKLIVCSNPATATASTAIVSHDVLVLTSKSDEQHVVSRMVSRDGDGSENQENKTDIALIVEATIAVSRPDQSQPAPQLMNSSKAPVLFSPDAMEPSPLPIHSVPSYQCQQQLLYGDSPSGNNWDESPIFETPRVHSQGPTPYRTNSQPQEAAMIPTVLFATSSDQGGCGLDVLKSSRYGQLAKFSSFPMIPDNSDRMQSSNVESLEDQVKNYSLSRLQEVKLAFRSARSALCIFDRLSGGHGNGTSLTRIWSEKRFAQVLHHAISRYETIMDSAMNPIGEEVQKVGKDDDLYISPPRRTFSMEDTIIRRLEHREALLKHLLKVLDYSF